VLKTVADENGSLEAKDIMGRFTTDVITSCAFGIDVSSLKDPNSEFNGFTKTFSNRTLRDAITATLGYILPQLIPILGVSIFRNHAACIRRNKKNISFNDFQLKFVPPKLNDFFFNCVKSTIQYREENNVKRNDFMQLLMELKDKGYVEDPDEPTAPIPDYISGMNKYF